MKTWGALLAVLTAMFVLVQIAYHTGAEGMRARGGTVVSFNRGIDQQLFAVGPDIAVAVSRGSVQSADGELPLLIPRRVAFPFSALCGVYEGDGFIRDPAAARAAPALAGHAVSVRPHPIPGERDRVTVQMPVSEVAARLRPLSTCNESCTTVNAAFLLLYAALLASGPVVFLRSRRRGPAGA